MDQTVRNINIESISKLDNPKLIKEKYPINDDILKFVYDTRDSIKNILLSKEDRFIIIVGPCSIHNLLEAYKYALFLKEMINKYSDKLLIIMRTYLSKPRTCLGWKGFLYDPKLDGSYDINYGIKSSRKLLTEINMLGVPCSMEYLDTISPQYLDDVISWGAIGARTTESQIHRELASAISTPIGFKNNLDGNINVAINSIKCSSQSQCFLGCDLEGNISCIKSKGNTFGHIILRGSNNGPNYDFKSVVNTKIILDKNNINTGIIIDCSHGNSEKDYKKQINGVNAVLEHIKTGLSYIKGIMLESNLKEGNQSISLPLKNGISITDSCIGIEETEEIIKKIYDSL